MYLIKKRLRVKPKSEKCVANNAAKTTLKSNNKKHNDIAPNGSQIRLPTKG